MSKLSELKNTLDQATKSEKQNTKQIVQQAMSELNNSLTLECQNVSSNFSKNMEIEQQKLLSLTKMIFRINKFWILLGITILLAIPLIAWGIFSYLTVNEYQEMEKWKKSAEIYKAESKGILFGQCKTNQGVKTCVKIDPNFKDIYWNKGTFVVIQTQPTKTTTKTED